MLRSPPAAVPEEVRWEKVSGVRRRFQNRERTGMSPQAGNGRSWRIPLKNSAVQRHDPVSRIFDGPSETTIL
jgi:hypothetical protein